MSIGRTVVRWPQGYEPEGAPVHTYDELEVKASPENCWAWLIRAGLWPTWYPRASKVVIDGGGSDIGLGTVFHWNTLGVRVHTEVTEFEPYRRLGWTGRALGGRGFHGWVLEPRDGGCLIVTEETQRGWSSSMGRWYLRSAIHQAHQVWLRELGRVAATGPPPA